MKNRSRVSNIKHINKIISILKKHYPDFKTPIVTEFSSITPYHVLFSCILSLRTKDEVTAVASKRLFSTAPNVHALQKLSIKTIKDLIYPVGFYKTKAKRIKEISREIITKYNSVSLLKR